MNLFRRPSRFEGVNLRTIDRIVKEGMEYFSEKADIAFFGLGATELDRLRPERRKGRDPGCFLAGYFREKNGSTEPLGHWGASALLYGESKTEPRHATEDTARLIHLTLGSVMLGDGRPSTIPFAGHLDLVKSDSGKDVSLLYAGQGLGDFLHATDGNTTPNPTATYTMGEYFMNGADGRAAEFGRDLRAQNDQPNTLQIFTTLSIPERQLDRAQPVLDKMGIRNPMDY